MSGAPDLKCPGPLMCKSGPDYITYITVIPGITDTFLEYINYSNTTLN